MQLSESLVIGGNCLIPGMPLPDEETRRRRLHGGDWNSGDTDDASGLLEVSDIDDSCEDEWYSVFENIELDFDDATSLTSLGD